MGFSPYLISRIAGGLPAGLAAGELAASLPASSGFGFELDLASGRTDLSVRLTPADGSAGLFRGTETLEALCRHWDGIDLLWLEYDAPETGASWQPSLGFYRLSPVFAGLDDATAQAFLTRLLERVGTGFAAPLACEIVQRLRPLAALRHLGFSLGRAQRDARLCFTVGRDAVAVCLDRLGLSAQAPQLLPLLEALAPPGSLIVLHVDTGAQLGGRLGLEIAPAREEDWEPMLDTLLAHGLCSPDTAAAICLWPTPEPGPEAARGLSPTLPAAAYWDEAILLRRLNHIKLGAGPDNKVTAKAYLYSGLLWDHAAMRGIP